MVICITTRPFLLTIKAISRTLWLLSRNTQKAAYKSRQFTTSGPSLKKVQLSSSSFTKRIWSIGKISEKVFHPRHTITHLSRSSQQTWRNGNLLLWILTNANSGTITLNISKHILRNIKTDTISSLSTWLTLIHSWGNPFLATLILNLRVPTIINYLLLFLTNPSLAHQSIKNIK